MEVPNPNFRLSRIEQSSLDAPRVAESAGIHGELIVIQEVAQMFLVVDSPRY